MKRDPNIFKYPKKKKGPKSSRVSRQIVCSINTTLRYVHRGMSSNYTTPTNLLGFNWDESDGNVVEFHYAIDTNIAHEEALLEYNSLLENNLTGGTEELFGCCGGLVDNPFDKLCFLIPCLCPCLVASSVLCVCNPCKWLMYQEARLAYQNTVFTNSGSVAM